jgi:hypothetical protein
MKKPPDGGGVVRLGSGISRHPGNAQGAPANPGRLLAKPQSVSGIAELISSGQTAKLGHLCVSVEADAIGPGLAVVDFDAVHVGHGVNAMGWIDCREAPAGWGVRLQGGSNFS